MGQAFDRDGNVLGEAYGDTRREVFEKLQAEFKNAHEIRIRTLESEVAPATAESFGLRAEMQPVVDELRQRMHASSISRKLPEDLIAAMLGMAERWRKESGTAGWQLAKESCSQDLVALVKAIADGEVVIALKFPETLPAV